MTFELHDYDNNHFPYVENVTSNSEYFVLINECLDWMCETQRLDDLRVEKITMDYHEYAITWIIFVLSTDLEFNFLMLKESRSLLELVDLEMNMI